MERPLTPIAVLLIATSFVAACSGDDGRAAFRAPGKAPGDAARGIAVAIDRERPALVQTEWAYTTNTDSATIIAFAAGDSLRLIRERRRIGDRGGALARYYFQSDELRYYESEAETVAPEGEKDGAMQTERLVLAFDPGGTVVESSRQLSGATAPVDSALVAGVLNRARELVRQWREGPLPR